MASLSQSAGRYHRNDSITERIPNIAHKSRPNVQHASLLIAHPDD